MMNYGQMYQQQQPAAYQQMYQQAQASPAQQAGYMQQSQGMQASPGYQAAQQSYGTGYGQTQQAQSYASQAYQQTQQAQQPQQARQPQQAQQPCQQPAAKDELVGNVAHINVQGCTHAMVGGIVRGSFTANGQNHGRPTYKKDQQVNGLDVQMYYWDERDGPSFSGWWFGPKVGGDQVWAYHPNKDAMTPPKTGWKVPYDGPVDQTFVISASQGQQQQQQPQQQQPQQQQGYGQQGYPGQQQQQQGYQQQGYQQNQQQAYQQQQEQQRLQQQQQQQQQQQMLKQQEQQRQQQIQQQMQQQQEARRQQEQLKQQQMMAMKAKQDEMRRQQQEELKRRADEQKRQMEEAQRKRMEDQKRQAEEARACFEVRQVIQQIRVCTEQTLATKQQELAEIMVKNLAQCGAQGDKIKKESEQAVEQTKKRIEAIQEVKRKDEERKAEAARKLKEAQEKAETLVNELAGKIDSAEQAVKSLAAAAEALEGTSATKMTAIKKAGDKFDAAAEEATEALKACASFMSENNTALMVAIPAKPQEPGTTASPAPTRLTLNNKFNELSKSKNATFAKATATKNTLIKKCEAKAQLDSKSSKFSKYDLNKDGLLDEKEVSGYAKKEFGLSLPKPAIAKIMSSLAQDGKKGVRKDDFQVLAVQVGIAREATKDAQRRKKREAHEKQLEEMKTSLRDKMAEVEQSYAAAEEKVKFAEEAGKTLSPAECKKKKSQEILPAAEEVESKLQEARGLADELQKEVAGIKEDINQELLEWITNEVKPLATKSARLLSRLQIISAQLTKARADAKVKDAAELKALEVQVVAMLKYHQQAKNLTVDDMLAAVSKSKESVDKASFLAFFEACEKKQPSEEESKAGKVAAPPSDADLERVFMFLVDIKDSEAISKDRMLSLIRTYMKVTKETVLTSSVSIKATDSKRRLEVGEVLEILSPPSAEGEVDEVKRVQCRTLKDGLEGWATISGNQGSKFLEPYNLTFKVVKETIMTEYFELDSEEAKEASKQLKDREPRKLKPGEIVDVWILPRKEEKSGLERLKCRTKKDGQAGWVTAVGNAGTVFLQRV